MANQTDTPTNDALRATPLTLREGDVYRFTYHPHEAKRRFEPHHCFDGQVVVRNGKLCDTYWAGYKLSRGCVDERVVQPHEGTLTFVCNLNDVREIPEYERRYYDAADVFNLSYQHGCYKFFAVRKDAQRSQAAMLAWLDNAADELRADIRWKQRHLEQIAEQRAKVAAGDTEVSIG